MNGLQHLDGLGAMDSTDTTQLETQLFLTSSAGWLCGRLSYSTQLYLRTTVFLYIWCYCKPVLCGWQVEQIVCRMSALMAEVVDPQTAQGSTLRGISTREVELLTERWGATAAPYGATTTVVSLFDQHTCTAGVALMFEGESISYTELERRTSWLVLGLGTMCRNRVVGLCVEKSIEEVAGMVGIMRAGAAYVPLDPKLPQERLQYLVDRCSCVSVVAQRRYEGSTGSKVPELIAESVMSRSDNCHASNIPEDCSCEADLVAYVLFTSGSTGKPKVFVLHSYLWAECVWFRA